MLNSMTDHDTPAEPAAAAPEASEVGRAEQRRVAFLAAARDVFLEFGYEQANMAEIVRRAGGSLATLYSQFGGKQGLFEAVIASRIEMMTRQMHIELAAHAPVEQGLRRIGGHYLRHHVNEQGLEVYRLMVAQARNFPDMAEAWASQVGRGVRLALASYLKDRVTAGEIRISDCTRAASLFLDLVRARTQIRMLAMPSYRPGEAELDREVDDAVRVFLGGVGALD